MADRCSNIEPTSLVANHVKEIQCHDVADRHDDHEECRRGHTQPAVQDPQVCADNGKGDQNLKDQESCLRKRIEDGNESIDTV